MLIYLLFLLILGLPIMVMEFSVGRASQASAALSFDRLEPKGGQWHWFRWGHGGNYLLMMFYTTIAGWMVAYLSKWPPARLRAGHRRRGPGVPEMLSHPCP